MDFKDIVLAGRSYRRFDQSHRLSKEVLLELVELARNTPSTGNRQLLRYMLSCSPEYNQRIFETLGWAASLPDWPGPEEGERPAGYIVITADKSGWDWLRVDLGVAAQTIVLGAVSKGLGACILGSIRKEELRRRLDLAADQELQLVIALGKPVERVELENVAQGDSLTYYRTEDRVHHVPKLRLEDLVLGIFC